MDDFISELAQVMRKRYSSWIATLCEYAATLGPFRYIHEQHLLKPADLDLHGDDDPEKRRELSVWNELKFRYKRFYLQNQDKSTQLERYFSLKESWNLYHQQFAEYQNYQNKMQRYTLDMAAYNRQWSEYHASGVQKVKRTHRFRKDEMEKVYTLPVPTIAQPAEPYAQYPPREPQALGNEPIVQPDSEWSEVIPAYFTPVEYMMKAVFGRLKGMDAQDARKRDKAWEIERRHFFHDMNVPLSEFVDTH